MGDVLGPTSLQETFFGHIVYQMHHVNSVESRLVYQRSIWVHSFPFVVKNLMKISIAKCRQFGE